MTERKDWAEQSKMDMKRIAACVNACVGIRDPAAAIAAAREALQRIVDGSGSMWTGEVARAALRLLEPEEKP